MSKLLGIIIIVIIFSSIISFLIRIYNRLVMLKFNIEKSFANIDVLLKQRAEEIPNLVNTVKAFMSHEKEVLNELTRLRTSYLNAQDQNQKVEITNQLAKSLGQIMVVAENYPDLKSDASFLSLQNRISELEDNIADRREFFNESVNMYNIGINEFPNLLLAKPMGYREKSLLEIPEAEKKYDGVTF